MSPSRLLLACAVLLALALLGLFLRETSRAGPAVPPSGGASAREHGEPGSAKLDAPPPFPNQAEADRHAVPRPEEAESSHADAAERSGAWIRLLTDTHAPLPGFEVRFAIHDPLQPPDARPTGALTSSDGEGRIDLREHLPGEGEERRIEVSPLDPRLELLPGSFARTELGSTPARALELRLAPRATAPFRGRALDARSGEPLPGFAFRPVAWNAAESEDPDRPRAGSDADGWRAVGFREPFEWLVTDATGAFTAERDFPTGRLTLGALHGEQAQVALDSAGSPVEARFTVGPVLLLDFHPPGGRAHDDFLAALYRAPEEAGLDTELREPLSPWSPKDSQQWGNASPVRPGPPPWVRLAADELAHPLPTFVILVSRDGAAKGVARIDALERYRTEPLFVEVEELCALTVSFRQSPEARPKQCQLQLLTAETGAALARRWGNTGGRIRFQGLSPGLYGLELVIEQRETMRLEVSLPTSHPAEFILPDLAKGELHTLVGEVLTDSGLPLDGQDGRAFLFVSAIVGGRGSGMGLRWEGGRAQFSIADLEAGEYRLISSFGSGGFEVEPRSVMATLPGPPVTIRVHDGGTQEHLELWVLNPPSQGELTVEGRAERLPQIHFYSSTPSDQPLDALPDGRPARRVVAGPYPAGAFETLRLRGEGRRTLQVETRDFTRIDGRLTAEVTMLDGWSAQFSITDEEGTSLAGLVLALDGVPLRATDEQGHVQVEAEAKPARLSVVTPGWTLVEHHSWGDWGTVFESGEFTVEDGLVDVFLRRVP